MTPQEKLRATAIRMKWYLEDKPKGFRIHIYDLLKEFRLITNMGTPRVDPTSMAVKLSEYRDLIKVESIDSSGPYHHTIERL